MLQPFTEVINFRIYWTTWWRGLNHGIHHIITAFLFCHYNNVLLLKYVLCPYFKEIPLWRVGFEQNTRDKLGSTLPNTVVCITVLNSFSWFYSNLFNSASGWWNSWCQPRKDQGKNSWMEVVQDVVLW